MRLWANKARRSNDVASLDTSRARCALRALLGWAMDREDSVRASRATMGRWRSQWERSRAALATLNSCKRGRVASVLAAGLRLIEVPRLTEPADIASSLSLESRSGSAWASRLSPMEGPVWATCAVTSEPPRAVPMGVHHFGWVRRQRIASSESRSSRRCSIAVSRTWPKATANLSSRFNSRALP